MTEGYRMLDHTADFRLEIFGDNPTSLFRQAALALSDLITDPAALQGARRRTISVRGDDWPDLMVNWLRELLYCWHGDGQLIARAAIHDIGPFILTAEVTYDDYAPGHHEIRNEIKGVTYHQIEVREKESGWVARVVVDI